MNVRASLVIATLALVCACWLLFFNASDELNASSENECSVYHALLRLHNTDERLVFASVTRSFKTKVIFEGDPEYRAPSHFRLATRQAEPSDPLENGDSVESPFDERIEFDTEGMFEAVISSEPRNLTKCFAELSESPSFSSGPLWTLRLRAILFDSEGDGNHGLNWIHVSRVGFSEDGKEALLYTEQNCGGMCQSGYFLLFAKHDSEWTVLGCKLVWAS